MRPRVTDQFYIGKFCTKVQYDAGRDPESFPGYPAFVFVAAFAVTQIWVIFK
jgi:hypothetical protein